jgi:hypothetical protein
MAIYYDTFNIVLKPYNYNTIFWHNTATTQAKEIVRIYLK